ERPGYIFFAGRDLSDESASAQRDADSCLTTNYVCKLRRGFVRESGQFFNMASRSLPAICAAPLRIGISEKRPPYNQHRNFCRASAVAGGYKFVITPKGSTDNASVSFTRRCFRGIGRHVNRSCALLNESVSGNSTTASFHNSPIGGKPTREESRGEITTIHLSARLRTKLTQHSENVPLARSGRYSPRWKRSACSWRNRNTRWVRNNFIRPSGHVCINSSGVALGNASSISRRRL